MLRDLLDALRCPATHEESWLVAMVHHATGPELHEADLACPVCGAEYAVREGVAYFAPPGVTTPSREALDESPDVMRLAALLNLAEDPLPVLLGGSYHMAGEALLQLMPANTQVWIDADAGSGALVPHERAVPERMSRLQVGEVIPLGVGTLAAAALDITLATPSRLASVVRAVRLGGRIVAPSHVPVPSGVKELARDQREWVAEVATRASGLVELRRRAPDQVG